MTISPCSQGPANCCAVKLRWNAAPALSISERESSSLWLPLNSRKSFCQGQRGAGDPTCCTRLYKVSIAMGSNKYRPSMLEYLSLRAAASSAAEPASRAAPAIIIICKFKTAYMSAMHEGESQARFWLVTRKDTHTYIHTYMQRSERERHKPHCASLALISSWTFIQVMNLWTYERNRTSPLLPHSG